jgi:hypothetical protein
LVRPGITGLVAVLIAGCAAIGTPNVDRDYRPGANGLLVVSLTASGYNPGTLWFQVVRAGSTTQAVASIPVNDEAYGLDWLPGDLATENGGSGRVAVVELAPGEYELRRWVINVSNQAAFSSTRAFGYRFTIVPGKATYLGSVHVDIQRGASPARLPFEISLQDRRERDLPIVHRKYSAVRPDQVLFPEAAREPVAERPVERAPTRLDDLQGLLPGR